MYSDLLRILQCPNCKGEFTLKETNETDGEEIVNATISCKCGQEYKVIDGVLNFGSEEQSFVNNWSSYYDKMKDDELDKAIDEKTPEKLKALFNKTKTYIVEALNKTKPNIIIDIASGRGMLATYISEHIDYSPMLLLTDLSFQVLKYDRLKIKKINPLLKVNYMACDCTHLPIADSTIDKAVSFYGITNMGDVAQEGIKESYRVLKENAKLLNAVILIDCTTEASKEMNKAYKEQLKINSFNETLSESGLQDIHTAGGFNNIDTTIIGEGVGEKNELDAIPIEGEWYAVAVLKATKQY